MTCLAHQAGHFKTSICVHVFRNVSFMSLDPHQWCTWMLYLLRFIYKINEKESFKVFKCYESHFKYGFFMSVVTCFRAYETVRIRTFIERKTANPPIWPKYAQAIHHLSQSKWLWRTAKQLVTSQSQKPDLHRHIQTHQKHQPASAPQPQKRFFI